MREASSSRMATDTDSYAFFIPTSKAQLRGFYRAQTNAMSENRRKEELQSRRQFFKNAAKATLPILGAAIISATPLKALATQSDSSYCDWGCSGSCSGSCGGACSYSCQNTCSGSCQGCRGCSGSCSYNCSTTCSGGCRSGNVY